MSDNQDTQFAFSAEDGISADGTFSDGDRIVLRDDQSRFGAKATQAPHMFDRQTDGQLVNGSPKDAYTDTGGGDHVPVGVDDGYVFEAGEGNLRLGDPRAASPPSPGRSGWYYAEPNENDGGNDYLARVAGWPEPEDDDPPKPRRQVYISWLVRSNWNLETGDPFDVDRPGKSAKVHRVWADATGGDGYRLSWTRMHATLTRVGEEPGDNVDPYPSWNGISWNDFERWHRLEIEIDYRDGGYTRCYIDGELVHDISILETNPDWVGSISPRLWGYNPSDTGWAAPEMVFELADYYVDSSLARVVLTNAESWENADRRVTQPHFSWTAGKLEIELYEGVLASEETVYIWVVDENGDPTRVGTLSRTDSNPELERSELGFVEGGFGSPTDSVLDRPHLNARQQYTHIVEDGITEVVRGGIECELDGGTIQIGMYDVTDGVVGAPRVFRQEITLPEEPGSVGDGHAFGTHVFDLDPVPLHDYVGRELAVAVRHDRVRQRGQNWSDDFATEYGWGFSTGERGDPLAGTWQNGLRDSGSIISGALFIEPVAIPDGKARTVVGSDTFTDRAQTVFAAFPGISPAKGMVIEYDDQTKSGAAVAVLPNGVIEVGQGSSATDSFDVRLRDAQGTVSTENDNDTREVTLEEETVLSPVNGFENPPHDLNGDGLYRDVNGDGSFNLGDVIALYDNYEDDSVLNNNPELFNFNGQENPDDVTLGDVIALYEEL